MTYNEYIKFLASEVLYVARDRAKDNEDNFAVVYYDVFEDENDYASFESFNLDLYNEIKKDKSVLEVEMGGYEHSSVEIVFKESEI